MTQTERVRAKESIAFLRDRERGLLDWERLSSVPEERANAHHHRAAVLKEIDLLEQQLSRDSEA